MNDRADSQRSVHVVIDREPAGGRSPWAPGGWTAGPIEPPDAPVRAPPSDPPPRRRRRYVVGAVALIVTVVAGTAALLAVDAGDRSTAPPPDAEVERTADEPADVAPSDPSDAFVQLPPITPVSETAVGPISWTRIDGTTLRLPARVGPGDGDEILGSDGSRRYVSIDGGRSWKVTTVSHDSRAVGGETWSVGPPGTAPPVLTRSIPDGEAEVLSDDPFGVVPRGWASTIVPSRYPADGFPVELTSEVFVLAERRLQLPWPVIAGDDPDGSFRVRVTTGERSVTAVAGDFHEMPVQQFTLSRTADGEWELSRPGEPDAAVWVFEAEDLAGAFEAISGRTEVAWLRWNGDGFERTAVPWQDEHRVQMIELGDRFVAHSTDAAYQDTHLWTSTDGTTWSDVALPTSPRADYPINIAAGQDDVVVTILTEEGWTNWSTTDGEGFDLLPKIPGIGLRSKGEFGWIAPDPRSFPRIRVSPDGEEWETIDLRDPLGLDASSWDVSITARALGSTIFVIATSNGERTMLIGEVG